MKVIVAVDPGTVSLGLALFKAKDRGAKRAPRPIWVKAHSLAGSFKGGVEQNALRVGDIFRRAIEGHRVEIVYCERMEFQPGARGHAAVNDVLGVAFACGVIAEIAKQAGASFHAAPVSKWKGQLSKVQVARRIVKHWGGKYPEALSDPASPSHDWDAVGIGLWGMGHF